MVLNIILDFIFIKVLIRIPVDRLHEIIVIVRNGGRDIGIP